MPAVLKNPKSKTKAIKPIATPKDAHVVSEVDLLIARLKRFRKDQRGDLNIRQAIEGGRD